MRVYASAPYAGNAGPADRAALRAYASTGYPSVLISYVYDRERTFFEKLGYWPEHSMGDSGAFSVWTLGETIDLDDYIAWCRYYTEATPGFVPISLDVIPGRPGTKPTMAERERAMAQSVENGDQIRAAGVGIMEVYHWHEPIEHLDRLLARRQPGELLGIGGLASGGSRTEKVAFCDQVFAHVRDACGWNALPPLHGLGVSPTSPLGVRYPWWSVDSSSWSLAGRFGRHVSGSGRRGDADPRTSNRTVRQIYLTRVLDSWQRHDRTLTETWASRGVRFAA